MKDFLAIIPAVFYGIRESLKIIAGGGMYRRFFENSNALQMIARIDGKIKDINPAFARELGYERDALRGKPFLGYVHPADYAKTIEAMQVLREGGEINSGTFQNRYICANQRVITLDWTAMGNGEIMATARIIATK